MKEIKFRVWDKETNKMYFQLNESPCFGLFEGDRAASIEDVFFYEKQQFELMQYTGLKDKNGKEIYEGDIVEFKTMTKRIERHYVEYSEYGEWCVGMHRLPMRFQACKVIGNIYENPELLEVN